MQLTRNQTSDLRHGNSLHSSIAFVGAGPTSMYTLFALLEHATGPFAATIFEEQTVVGRGTPYRPGWNDPAMLSNIASIEIPPLEETLVAWLARQTPQRLAALEIEPAEIDERAFYPRLVLGEFFKDQFDALVARARSAGSEITIRTRCRVTDAVSGDDGITLSVQSRGGATDERFDHVVLATGHQWPEEPEVRPGYFLSPWPASALADIPACRIGIRGSSLTAIDAAVALSSSRGEFVEEGNRLVYRPAANGDAFHITMLSRKGLLPEADFFHPVPYQPLSICTAAAMERLIASPSTASDGGLLEQAFVLFKKELAAADPAYAEQRAVPQLTLESFCESYFSDRRDVDPFVWAEKNLEEAERDYAAEKTVAWRYAILRMHEVIALIVPHLDPDELDRFLRYFKPIFVDEYATVPHESIKRLLALHGAGRLDVEPLGEKYRVDSHSGERGAVVHVGGKRLHFPVFIEATGQRPLPAKEFPFPTLLEQQIIRDESSADPAAPVHGIAIDDRFRPVSDRIAKGQLFCLSIPYLLGRHPFIQGITSSCEMGAVVGEELAKAIARKEKRP